MEITRVNTTTVNAEPLTETEKAVATLVQQAYSEIENYNADQNTKEIALKFVDYVNEIQKKYFECVEWLRQTGQDTPLEISSEYDEAECQIMESVYSSAEFGLITHQQSYDITKMTNNFSFGICDLMYNEIWN